MNAHNKNFENKYVENKHDTVFYYINIKFSGKRGKRC